MVKAEQIPDEVFEAFQKAWAVTSTLSTKECLAAAINAWPGMGQALFTGNIVLPLSPKEAGKGYRIPEYNADRGEQRTICEACGNANLAHERAKWTRDGSSYCPPCLPKEPEA